MNAFAAEDAHIILDPELWSLGNDYQIFGLAAGAGDTEADVRHANHR